MGGSISDTPVVKLSIKRLSSGSLPSEGVAEVFGVGVEGVARGSVARRLCGSFLREVDKQLQLLEDNDYNAERSRIAVRGVKSFSAPYEQLLCERRKTAKQQTLDVFFKSTPKKQSEDTEPQPSTSGIRRFFLPSHATKTAPDDDDTDDDDDNSQLLSGEVPNSTTAGTVETLKGGVSVL
ncbi:hypothetical protein Hamer_G016850 [Homarus americanus]|uniref:Uncharacterized protein n=1 Tax=Homarus americanus TaxID=6706 RepID=A0A8J5K142_HOMAM|nr:hypothetical protein Hamer_G016850 [Homarus americanus]